MSNHPPTRISRILRAIGQPARLKVLVMKEQLVCPELIPSPGELTSWITSALETAN